MMVCSCNCITDHAIRAAVDQLMLERPLHLLTPGAVYQALGQRPRCGGCLPNVQEIVQSRVACLRSECQPATCACKTAARIQADKAVGVAKFEPTIMTAVAGTGQRDRLPDPGADDKPLALIVSLVDHPGQV